MTRIGHNTRGEKRCSRCKRWLELDLFPKNKSAWDGLNAECKECTSKKNANLPVWQRRAKTIKRGFGMDWQEYIDLFEEQDHKCAICGASITSHGASIREIGCVDHDHETGTIRGLLCNLCNGGLGYFRDNVTFLENAIFYIRRKK